MTANFPGFILIALLMTSLAYGGTWPHSLRQHCIYLVVGIALYYWAGQRRRTPFG